MCVRLFGDYSGVILQVFWEELEGKTIQKTKITTAKTLFFLFKIALNSLFNEEGVLQLGNRQRRDHGPGQRVVRNFL